MIVQRRLWHKLIFLGLGLIFIFGAFQNCSQSYSLQLKEAPLPLALDTSTLRINEGTDLLPINLSRSIRNTKVLWQITPSQIGAGNDFGQNGRGEISVTDPTSKMILPVQALADSIYEGTEEFTLTLTFESTKQQISYPLEVVDSLAPPSIATTAASVSEGSVATLTLSYNIAPATDTQVHVFTTNGGNAFNGVDYVPLDRVLTLPAGQTQMTVSVQTLVNNNDAVLKSFSLISEGSGLVESISKTHTVNILPMAGCSLQGLSAISGQSISAYSATSVPFGSQCSSVLEQRLCTNGNLAGSFPYTSCTPVQPVNCLFAGSSVTSGSSIMAYQNSTVPYGQTCTSQFRSCSNGKLDGTYAYAACTVGAPANCPFNGSTVQSGQSVSAYEKNIYHQSQTPVSESRLCTNGKLDGTYPYSSYTIFVPPTLSLKSDAVDEGSNITVSAELSFANLVDTTSSYSLESIGTGFDAAVIGKNLQNASGTINIPSGQLKATITIPTLKDLVMTRTKAIKFLATNIVGANNTSSSVQLNIKNTDSPTLLITKDKDLYLPGDTANVFIAPSLPIEGTATVSCYTVDGTAISGVDFVGIPATSPVACTIQLLGTTCSPQIHVKWLSPSAAKAFSFRCNASIVLP